MKDKDRCLITQHLEAMVSSKFQNLKPVKTKFNPSPLVCPVCSDSIFPASNLVSPVADILRSRLGQVNWGRNELGLPLVSHLFFN